MAKRSPQSALNQKTSGGALAFKPDRLSIDRKLRTAVVNSSGVRRSDRAWVRLRRFWCGVAFSHGDASQGPRSHDTAKTARVLRSVCAAAGHANEARR